MRRKDDDKQNAIKKAVVKIVLEQGMHGTSISKIAKAAGVSPATVYVYYENKEVMLKAIYHEYAEEMFCLVNGKVAKDLPADQFIDIVIREYYKYMNNHTEIHNFVEQFSSCPSLSQGCMMIEGPDQINAKISAYKEQGQFNDYDISNIWAMLFYPVKGVNTKHCNGGRSSEQRLDELIHMIQRALVTSDF